MWMILWLVSIIVAFLLGLLLPKTLASSTEDEEFKPLAAPVDFRDDSYRFLRAIDGDTIIVGAPKELSGWVQDIRVRLYGLEVPEMHEGQVGERYRRRLEELCSIDAKGILHIVWEREALGTKYPGFPKHSFEREIGHVFFRMEDGRFVYINGLMHLLPESTYFANSNGKFLLRMSRSTLHKLRFRNEFCERCTRPFPLLHNASPTLQNIATLNPPNCLLVFPRLPSLDPRSGINGSFLGNCSCVANWVEQPFVQMIKQQKISLFDWHLLNLFRWRRYGTRVFYDPKEREEPIRGFRERSPVIVQPLNSAEVNELSKLENLIKKGLMMTSTEKDRLAELQGRKNAT